MKIGIVGAGKMGAAIAMRLIGLGHEVGVWNRTAAKALALTDIGIRAADTARQLAETSEALISILTDAPAIADVYGDMLAGNVAGRLFIEMSTVRPETQRSLEVRVRAAGGVFVECPVGGTVVPAREGKLLGLVGGHAADFALAKPLLEQLCRRVEHIGPVGAGASMKLAINLPFTVYWQVLGEALSLVQQLDLDPARVIDIFSDTAAAPAMLKIRAPAVVSALRGNPGPAAFDVESMLKDALAMVEEAKSLGQALPLTQRVLDDLKTAVNDGIGKQDCTALAAYWTAATRSGKGRASQQAR